jgi:hypothetical protein
VGRLPGGPPPARLPPRPGRTCGRARSTGHIRALRHERGPMWFGFEVGGCRPGDRGQRGRRMRRRCRSPRRTPRLFCPWPELHGLPRLPGRPAGRADRGGPQSGSRHMDAPGRPGADIGKRGRGRCGSCMRRSWPRRRRSPPRQTATSIAGAETPRPCSRGMPAPPSNPASPRGRRVAACSARPGSPAPAAPVGCSATTWMCRSPRRGAKPASPPGPPAATRSGSRRTARAGRAWASRSVRVPGWSQRRGRGAAASRPA